MRLTNRWPRRAPERAGDEQEASDHGIRDASSVGCAVRCGDGTATTRVKALDLCVENTGQQDPGNRCSLTNTGNCRRLPGPASLPAALGLVRPRTQTEGSLVVRSAVPTVNLGSSQSTLVHETVRPPARDAAGTRRPQRTLGAPADRSLPNTRLRCQRQRARSRTARSVVVQLRSAHGGHRRARSAGDA